MRNALTDMRDTRQGRYLDPGRITTRLRRQSRGSENHTSTFVDSFIAGATSGAVAAVVTTPFDVGKTRQQVLKNDGPSSGQKGIEKAMLRPEERSMPRFLAYIWQTEGTSGLFRGWAARCLKVAPACAIMISSYEIGKKMFKHGNERGRAASKKN